MKLSYWAMNAPNNSTVQSLPELAVGVASVAMSCTASTGAGLDIPLSPVTGTPGTTQFQFTGSPTNPLQTVTLGVAPVTNQHLEFKYQPAAGHKPGA